MILLGFDLDFKNKNGNTALIISTESMSFDCIKLLILNGA